MGVSDKERRLAETLRDPVLWGQAYLYNRDGSARSYWDHQKEDLRCSHKNIIHLDGRDVGKCLRGDTLITDCQTGERIRIDALKEGRYISVLGPDQTLYQHNDYRVLSNGVRPCWRLTTKLGREIAATDNHPLLTDRGWIPLGALQEGSWIAVPSLIPTQVPENKEIRDEELKLLAFLIADGSIAHTAVVFTKDDPIMVDEFKNCVRTIFPELHILPVDKYGYHISTCRHDLKNSCMEWLRQHSLMGKKSARKEIPEIVYKCSLRQIGVFLSRLFACDGWFYHAKNGGSSEISYCSASKTLIQGISNLLLRFGIISGIRKRMVKGTSYWCVEIRNWENISKFIRSIGMTGFKGACLDEFAEHEPENGVNAHDRIPIKLVEPIIANLKNSGVSTEDITGSPNRRLRLNRYNPSRWLIRQYAENTDSIELAQLSHSEIYWDQIAEIRYEGEAETYDLSVPDYCNFIANDIIVHNSIVLSTDALHYAFTTRGGKGLIAAPHQGHLDTVIEEIEYQLDHNEDLMNSIAISKYGKPKITRKPYFRLEFTNGSVIYFRPAGAYGDAFRSLHVDRVWVDEGAWLSERAWKALRQCLKTGGRLKIYSTPNGLRNTTYYRLTLSQQFRVFRWASWLNPNWTADRELELLEFYGGKDTSGWQHEVAGEHGKPSYGTFNVEQFNLCRQELLEYQKITISDAELRDCETEEAAYDRLEMMLNLTPRTGLFWIGGDLGYTNDPTELVIFQEAEVGDRSILKLVLRIHMEHVSYPHIAQTIALLERYFTPAGIGVDNGGNGLAVVQELLTLDKYKELELEGRLKGFDFGGMTRLTVRDGKEIKKRTKELMTSLINGAIQRKQIIFPSDDLEIEDQFTTQTYTLRDGKIIYSKGNDHIIDAVRCAMLIREQGNLDLAGEETVWLKPVLTEPIFF